VTIGNNNKQMSKGGDPDNNGSTGAHGMNGCHGVGRGHGACLANRESTQACGIKERASIGLLSATLTASFLVRELKIYTACPADDLLDGRSELRRYLVSFAKQT